MKKDYTAMMIFDRLYKKDLIALSEHGINTIDDLFVENVKINLKQSELSRALRNRVQILSARIRLKFTKESINENGSIVLYKAVLQSLNK